LIKLVATAYHRLDKNRQFRKYQRGRVRRYRQEPHEEARRFKRGKGKDESYSDGSMGESAVMTRLIEGPRTVTKTHAAVVKGGMNGERRAGRKGEL